MTKSPEALDPYTVADSLRSIFDNAIDHIEAQASKGATALQKYLIMHRLCFRMDLEPRYLITYEREDGSKCSAEAQEWTLKEHMCRHLIWIDSRESMDRHRLPDRKFRYVQEIRLCAVSYCREN